MVDSTTTIPCLGRVSPGESSARSQSVRPSPPVPRKTNPKVLQPTLSLAGGKHPATATAVLLIPGAHSGVEQCDDARWLVSILTKLFTQNKKEDYL